MPFSKQPGIICEKWETFQKVCIAKADLEWKLGVGHAAQVFRGPGTSPVLQTWSSVRVASFDSHFCNVYGTPSIPCWVIGDGLCYSEILVGKWMRQSQLGKEEELGPWGA